MCMFFRQDFSGLFYFLPFIEFVCSFFFYFSPFLLTTQRIFFPLFFEPTFIMPKPICRYILSALFSSQKISSDHFEFTQKPKFSLFHLYSMFSPWSILSSNCFFVLLVIVILLLSSSSSSSRVVQMISAQEQQTSRFGAQIRLKSSNSDQE